MRNLMVAAFLCAAGCAKIPSASPTADQPADTEFNRLADEFATGYLAWRPQTGTALGLHEYDGKLTDYSPASLAAEQNRLKSVLNRLAGLQTNRLTPRAFYDYRLLRSAVERELFGFEKMRSYTRNPMTYAGALDANVYIKRDFAPLPARMRSLIEILNQTPRLMEAARANLDESVPRPQIEVAIEQAEGAADFLGGELIQALRGVDDPGLKRAFAAANGRAIKELRDYVDWLRKEKLPQANERYALGRENYVEMLRCGEMVELSPESLLERGLSELRKAQQRFAELARQIDPDRSPIEVFQAIQKDHPSEQNLIADTKRDLEKIRHFLVDQRIVTLPSPVRAMVQEMPKYLRATGFASMDTPGPFETGATQAYYYVTPPEADWSPQQKEEWLTAFNYYTTEVVSIHEAYPGHYVQFLCLKASRANRLEKMFNSYAFIEGWAHYAEEMMMEAGYGAGEAGASATGDRLRAAKCRLAQVDEALLRLCRFCVSIQMHCQGMSVDEATAFFRQNCYFEEIPARQEARRGAYDPEYLYYTLGKLELLKLRDDYRRQEGPRFSLLKFHDALLSHGAPPLRLLRELMLHDPALWDKVL